MLKFDIAVLNDCCNREVLKKKFNACAKYGNVKGSASALYDKILNVELLTNTRELFS